MFAKQVTVFPIGDLPAELLLRVSSCLSLRFASRLARANRDFHRILNIELYKRSRKGWFPLAFGACTENTDTLALCIELGAPVDFQIRKVKGHFRWCGESYYEVGGWRALRQAIHDSRPEAVKFLLDHGSCPNSTPEELQHSGEPPLVMAFRRGPRAPVEAKAIAIALLDAGADTSTVSETHREELLKMKEIDGYFAKGWI
ncbi:uncharacterized protein B0J16DRAFT_409823 [Fusarium flagelliforme]|uniref:Uncharacterized protein n=1 Tax=Fusarium flagelliforme TaxID=2675880 RepID=A0A395MB38_9HYPO|nr:uncharacterized protein B0J16DRAFT_409823 [Fusarium flagelliforme]KAH7198290.1 hypothetical protein B0J16DRAFT_409823 [Fusarium flagelliforme]RFN44299.1 hypothetical protein FIE12Z_11464 [Fusarium flagelliforme]